MARVSLDTGTARRLRDGMAGGVLSFPLTSFHDDGTLDPEGLRAHVAAQVAAAPGAVFPACGTGEFFSLDEDEYRQVVTVAVEEAGGRLPVVAGIGYGWAQAVRFARIPEEGGADALLRLPHPLVAPPPGGRPSWSPPRRTASSPSWNRSPPAPGCRSSHTSAAKSPSPPGRCG